MATPTNSDIIREVREITKRLDIYGHEIDNLKEWKIAVEAARQALKEDREAHPRMKQDSSSSSSLKLLFAAISIITILGGVIVILAQAKK